MGITGILWDECGILHHWSGIFGNDNRVGFCGGLAIGFWVVEKGVEKVVEGWDLLRDGVVEKWGEGEEEMWGVERWI